MLKEGELLTLSTILPLWVMSFAGGAKVLNPPELKDMVKKAAEEILKNN